METAMAIGFLAVATFILLAIKWAIRSTINTGVNAAENAYKRAQERKNPPQQENLADWYQNNSESGYPNGN